MKSLFPILGLLLGMAVLRAPAEPSPTPAPAPVTAEALPSPSPTPKIRPLPFKSTIVSIDTRAGVFKIGKRKIRTVHVLPTTKLLRGNGTPAVYGELVAGAEIRGSLRKRDDGDFDAVSLKVAPKSSTVGMPPVAAEEGDTIP